MWAKWPTSDILDALEETGNSWFIFLGSSELVQRPYPTPFSSSPSIMAHHAAQL